MTSRDRLNDVPACVVFNESLINISSLLKRYSFADAADEVKLRGKLALWRQRWMCLKTESNVVVPETAADASEACDLMTFLFIHTFLRILVTLPVSTASAERSFSSLRRLKAWLRSRMTDQLTGLALMNIRRDIPVDVHKVMDRCAKSNRRPVFVL
jgi:hAT family C-terminal dimerisation region